MRYNTSMTEQTPVDPRPDWLRSVQAEGTEIGSLEVNGKIYPYTLVRKGLAPTLPYAVGFKGENTLFIEIGTPNAEAIMKHEVQEQTTFALLPEPERCRAALEAELHDVKTANPEAYSNHLEDRLAFFIALNQHYEIPEERAAVTEGFLTGIAASRDYLQQLTEEIKKAAL